MKTIDDVSGVILAGGKSSRYGKDKAFVKINGLPLIESVIEVMGSVFQEVIIITNTPNKYSYLGLSVYEDTIKGLGPLGGIVTGLTAISKEAGFFVACDMPFLNRELLLYMTESKGEFDAVIPRISGKMEALHGLYRKTCLPAIKRLIDSRVYQVLRFFSEVSVRYVDEGEIRQFDPDLRCFLNVNTPEELQEIEKSATRFNNQ
jgi:molybdopterin-guanine dinucleotide biosynthesis protein A